MVRQRWVDSDDRRNDLLALRNLSASFDLRPDVRSDGRIDRNFALFLVEKASILSGALSRFEDHAGLDLRTAEQCGDGFVLSSDEKVAKLPQRSDKDRATNNSLPGHRAVPPRAR
jgi:hypothetical protein